MMLLMEEQNPYASPRYASAPELIEAQLVDVEVVDATSQWRWRDFLLVPREATLPGMCIKCGEPTDRPLKKQRVYWYTPWVLLALLIHFWVFIILALIVRRKGVVFRALCEKHERRRRRAIAIAWTLCLSGVGLIAYGIYLSSTRRQNDLMAGCMMAAVVLLLAGLIVGIRGARALQVKYIDKNVIWLKKLPLQFYAHLPELRSADGRNPIGPWTK
jgi:hypothetical protein